ncbi:hypothetical protein MLD38_012584 [Melastoma candidum]|uniref:Uncharacterized protein n=1 Tax=Melastoma candidum TaxID=119954 RepID=A0ACB9R6T9_9MYRT|nr:hypothetical protein MLD38_012584 [Melastoma candidum]
MLFGRVRASPSTEQEIHASKLLKHDSFSVYECTLLKLKLGSQRSSCSPSNALDSFPPCMDIDPTPVCPLNFAENVTPGDASPATAADSPSPVRFEPPPTAVRSIPSLFSKYKASHHCPSADETSKLGL